MSKYSSTMSCTSNEQGDHEVELVYANGLIRSLLRLKEKKEVYVGFGGTVWYEKGTGSRAGISKESEICDVVEYHRQRRVYVVCKATGYPNQ